MWAESSLITLLKHVCITFEDNCSQRGHNIMPLVRPKSVHIVYFSNILKSMRYFVNPTLYSYLEGKIV